MTDVVAFALLYQHHRAGQAIDRSIAAGVIQPLRTVGDAPGAARLRGWDSNPQPFG